MTEILNIINGLIVLPWWGYIIITLVLTHITIASVTIFLHRHQAHRALDIHPVVSHFFRFWLWLTTGMVTKEWAAIHRKHHARCETPEDPHSPQILGINKVLWDGIELYRTESKNQETLKRYGQGTPDDWLERNLYSKHASLGIVIMLLINLVLFGPAGLAIWAIQMVWIPFFAAGVINGLAHYWGYRNFESADASANISPLGLLIGGEELHNNHHTYPASAKLSVKWWEFDIGWMYIRLLAILRLARIKKTQPIPVYDLNKNHIDTETVKAVISNRFQVMSRFAKDVLKRVYREELEKIGSSNPDERKILKKVKKLLTREDSLLDDQNLERLRTALDNYDALSTVYAMKKKLQDIWQRSASTQDNLMRSLEEWCAQAEATGIRALEEFSRKLKTYTLQPAYQHY